jgi:hypothetical protein
MHLIRSAYDALPPGGALVAIEALIDGAHRENVQGLLMSLNMLIEFGDAFDYSGADFRQWCGGGGLQTFRSYSSCRAPRAQRWLQVGNNHDGDSTLWRRAAAVVCGRRAAFSTK